MNTKMEKTVIRCMNCGIVLSVILLFSFSLYSQVPTKELPSIPWHTINKTHIIGRLLFEGNSIIIQPQLTAFVEIYGGSKSEKSIPEVNVTFGCPVINNQETPLVQAYAKQVLGTAIPATPNITYIISEQNNITVHLSPEIKEQSKNEIIQVIFPDFDGLSPSFPPSTLDN